MNRIHTPEVRAKILFQNSSKLTGVTSRTAIRSLCFFAKSNDTEVRMRALEKLGGYKSAKVSKCLIHALSHEKTPLILIAAMESAKDLKLRSAEPLITTKADGKSYYYHADALGSITALTDDKGETAQTIKYQSYGKPVIVLYDQAAAGNPYLFTAREFDPESELYYYRARYYDWNRGTFA